MADAAASGEAAGPQQRGVPQSMASQEPAAQLEAVQARALLPQGAWSAWAEEVQRADLAAVARHPHDATVVKALRGQAGAADGEDGDGEEVAVTAVTAARLAAFVTARRLRALNTAFRALAYYTRLHREVWRRGHRAVLAEERASLPVLCLLVLVAE